MRPAVVIVVAAALAAPLLSCQSPGPQAPAPVYQGDVASAVLFEDLQLRDDVLENLELSYNTQDFNEFIKLIDGDFTFFFSAQDIAEGNVPFSQWGASEEIVATAALFGHDTPTGIRGRAAFVSSAVTEESSWGLVKSLFFPTAFDPVTSIDLTLTYPPGEFLWVAVPHNGETWYQKTVQYVLTVVVGETWFISGTPIDIGVTVRYSDFAGENIWRIVEWRDDI